MPVVGWPPVAFGAQRGGNGVGLFEEPTYRLYYCRHCGVQVQICPRCDHGNIYCAGECSRLAHRECLRRAGVRYQRTLRGARRHAQRQRRRNGAGFWSWERASCRC